MLGVVVLGKFRSREQQAQGRDERSDVPFEAFRRVAGVAMNRALRTRNLWLAELDAICEDLQCRGIRAALQRAAATGNAFSARFSSHRAEFYALRLPRGSEAYHRLWLDWLHKLEQANVQLAHAATQRNLTLLDDAAATLAEARPLLAALNGDRYWLAHFLGEDGGGRGTAPARPA